MCRASGPVLMLRAAYGGHSGFLILYQSTKGVKSSNFSSNYCKKKVNAKVPVPCSLQFACEIAA